MQARQMEIEKTEGVVESAVQNSTTRYGVRLGGIWYNGFGKVKVRKGDLVGVGLAKGMLVTTASRLPELLASKQE